MIGALGGTGHNTLLELLLNNYVLS